MNRTGSVIDAYRNGHTNSATSATSHIRSPSRLDVPHTSLFVVGWKSLLWERVEEGLFCQARFIVRCSIAMID